LYLVPVTIQLTVLATAFAARRIFRGPFFRS